MSFSSFKTFLVEEEKTAYFTFGRMNPPTIGHEKLLNSLAMKAGKNPYRVFLSQSVDPKKNPLQYQMKVKSARKMFPKYARSIMLNKKIKTVFDVASQLYNEGFKNVVMVVGSDRVREFDVLLNKYNGKKGRHGFYNFQKVNVVSAGARDPDADGVEGMSASKMRSAASENDFTQFSQGLPRSVPNAEAKKIFNAVRKGMGLKEENEFKRHVQLESVSEIREAFVKGELFKVGEEVAIKENGQIVQIKRLGSNYVIVEKNGDMFRKWLHDIEHLDEGSDRWYKDQPEWGTPESTKKAGKITPGQEKSVSELSMKKDKNLPNLKVPVKGPKGVSKYMRRKLSNTPYTSSNKKSLQSDIQKESAAYHKGMSKSTADKRKAHFKKGAKMDDDNPAAYKPAPGDAKAKTKTSKHTIRFRQMYGEKNSQVDIAQARIDREKESDKKRHDRMMDRARMRDVKKTNRES